MQFWVFTWHIVYANGLLEMLIMGHHLREKRPLHHTHNRGLFLIVGLKGGREEMDLTEGEYNKGW